MVRRRTYLIWFGAALLTGGALLVILGAFQDGFTKERELLPPPVQPAPDAVPVLERVGRLPGAYQGSQPTVAADLHKRIVVVGLDGSGKGMKLLRWESADAGETWTEPAPFAPWPPKMDFSCDAWLATDHRNRLFLVNVATRLSDRTQVPAVFRRSADGGRTWSEPVRIADLADKTVLGISPNGRRLAVAFLGTKVEVLQSGDTGKTWTLMPPPGLARAVPFGVVIDDEGRVAACWLVSEEGGKTVRSVVCVTQDGGRNWSTTELDRRSLRPQLDHPFNTGRQPALARADGGTPHVAYVADGGVGKPPGLYFRSRRGLAGLDSADPSGRGRCGCGSVPGGCGVGRCRGHRLCRTPAEPSPYLVPGLRDDGKNWSRPLLLSPAREGSLVGPDGFDAVAGFYVGLADSRAGSAHAVWGVAARKDPPRSEIWHARVVWRVGGK